MPLLGTRPMSQVSDTRKYDDDDDVIETDSFDATKHVRHMEEVFSYYGTDVHKWTICTVWDNCNVNKSIAGLLGVPDVGCTTQKLSLEVNSIVQRHTMLRSMLEIVHDTMLQCKEY